MSVHVETSGDWDPADAAVFRGADGELWFDPVHVGVAPLGPFDLVEHRGAVYELWGRRPDGCWWVGRVSVVEWLGAVGPGGGWAPS